LDFWKVKTEKLPDSDIAYTSEREFFLTAITGALIVPKIDNLGNGVPLSKVSPKDKPWDKRRAEADEVARLYGMLVPRHNLSARIYECSKWLEFALNPDLDTGEIALRLKAAQFCRVRYCAVCQWRRSLRWVAKFMQKIDSIDLESSRWLHLTLTVKNIPIHNLRATLKEMNRAWKRLIERKRWPAIGFIRTTEITKSENGYAHPHFHCLLLVPASYFGKKYISHDNWTELWAEALRVDYRPSVRIQTLQRKMVEDPENGEVKYLAPVEALKYAVKPSDLVGKGGIEDAIWLDELTTQTHKLRFIVTGGVLKDILQENEETNEDLINISEKDDGDIELAHWFFLWFDSRYRKRMR